MLTICKDNLFVLRDQVIDRAHTLDHQFIVVVENLRSIHRLLKDHGDGPFVLGPTQS